MAAVDLDGLIAQGRAALRACAWADAERWFAEACGVAEVPEAIDGLGQALYWQRRYADALRLREQAYAGYHARGDRRAAAFVAVQLAQLHGLIHGNAVALNGWLGHAERMLADAADCPERGWLELLRGGIAADPVERERRTHAARDVARRFGLPDLEYDALGYLGKARVERGAVDEGMRLIDEAVAAAVSGLVADPWPAGEIYCSLFHACEMAGDVQRAEAWLASVHGYVEWTGELPISAICRMHYGGLLTAAGRWDDAERELLVALEIYDGTYRGSRSEPLLRLADLRVRQGRLEEAERLLDGYQDHPAAAVTRARMLHARGESVLAEAILARAAEPSRDAPLAGVPVLALRVDVRLATGSMDGARDDAATLTGLAEATTAPSVCGLALRARARVEIAVGARATARALLEKAMAAFAAGGLAHELAIARLDLARLLVDDAPEVAAAEARAACRALWDLGAAREADAAAHVLRRLGEPGRQGARRPGRLTRRQAEVLDLLAEGLSNAQIAERLYISPRTAEHHVSNILAALGLRSRGEAVAHVLRSRVRPSAASGSTADALTES